MFTSWADPGDFRRSCMRGDSASRKLVSVELRIQKTGPRFLNISLAVASAMLMLLSPARRILLFLSLILFSYGVF